jgi:hypothetical protein
VLPATIGLTDLASARKNGIFLISALRETDVLLKYLFNARAGDNAIFYFYCFSVGGKVLAALMRGKIKLFETSVFS